MITYRCETCGTTETAADQRKLDAFWSVVRSSSPDGAPERRYCGAGCLRDAQRAGSEEAVTIASYLDGVAAEAHDRPRALAAAILARALRRSSTADPAPIPYAEAEVGRESAGDDELAAEIIYEIGSILVELRERFPQHPLAFLNSAPAEPQP